MQHRTPQSSPSTVSAAAQQEYAQAFATFQTLLGRLDVGQLPPEHPATVYTTLVTTWLLVYQRLHAGCSLVKAVAELLQTPAVNLPDNRRVREGTLSANTAGYSRARKRLKPEVTEALADQAYRLLIAATPPSLGTRRVLMLDGTTVTLAPTPALKAAFPPATNQQGTSVWPVAHMLVVHELSSGCALLPELAPMYGDEGASELELTKRILPRIPADSVLLADRNFGIFAVAHAAVQAGHNIVFRLKEDRFRALCRSATLIEEAGLIRRWRLNWTPSAKEHRAHPDLPSSAAVQVYLHEIRLSAELTLWLVTTLESGTSNLAELYKRRVDVETDIRDVKVTLKIEELRAKSLPMLRKELATSILAYNLVVQVRRLAAQIAGVPPRRISFTGVLAALQVNLFQRPRDSADEQWRGFMLALKFAAQRILPNRPGRSYPRSALKRQSKSTSGKPKRSIPKPM